MQLKTVIFDLDDTLYTDWRTCHEAGLQNVDAYGTEKLRLAPGVMRQAFLNGRVRTIEQLGQIGSAHNRVLFAQFGLEALGVNPIAHAEKLHLAYWSGIFDTMRVEPEIPDLLDELRAAGVRVAVCTNMMADIQMRKLRMLGLADKIDFMITSEEAGADKPLPDIFRYVLHKVNCKAEEALMIGDNYEHDVCGAQSIGIAGMWINRDGVQMPAKGEQPAYYARSMGEAAAIVRDLLVK